MEWKSNFLGMRVTYEEDDGYHLDQGVMITDMLNEFGMEAALAVRVPIGLIRIIEDATMALPV